jgi:fluoride ion exporter CrcB/FEX
MKLLSAEYKTRKMGTFVIDLVGSLIIGVILSAMMAFIIKKSFLKENIVLEQVSTLSASIAYITTHAQVFL